MTNEALTIEKDFVVLSPDKKATIERFDSMLYERLGREYDGFKGFELISCHEFNESWSTWEIHPHGDEIVILLSGRATFVLQLETGKKLITLEKEGEYAVVPQNTWHTAKINVKTKILFITPGQDTQNKNV